MEDIQLLHNCLPGLNHADIDMRTSVAGLTFPCPLYLNAITGGAPDVAEINRKLAAAARICNMPIAVGSQAAGLEDSSVRESYTVVRDEYPDGLIMANVGGGASVEDAMRAVEMINADALQIHLNVAQELAMSEGDREFRRFEENVAAIAAGLRVPVIAKEVGFGIAREQARKLQLLGVSAIDIGGSGGTNFACIENARTGKEQQSFLHNWGIPTAVSLVEVITAVKNKTDVLASGGIRCSGDIVKALCLGAKAVGIAAPCLQLLLSQGVEALVDYLLSLKSEVMCMMLLTGSASVDELRQKPVIIMGRTERWLEKRGINTSAFAIREGV